MKVMITGAKGQVGMELQRTAPLHYEVVAHDRNRLDITKTDAVNDAVAAHKPDVIVNAAAYTAVDKAENDAEAAFRVNAEGARNVAQAALRNNTKLVHISTDFVFDGKKTLPYEYNDKPNPINVYGKSKLRGEEHVMDIADSLASVVRTSWVYSAYGKNFFITMLRLMRRGNPLRVVSDQLGTPTWANGLARAIWYHVEIGAPSGIFHWTYQGTASWYDFAVAIQDEAYSRGLLANRIPIQAVSSAEYNAIAMRPAYSALDVNLGKDKNLYRPEWRDGLCELLNEMVETKIESEKLTQ
jgi:dTDP-4-dehydrorhamnose reductase